MGHEQAEREEQERETAERIERELHPAETVHHGSHFLHALSEIPEGAEHLQNHSHIDQGAVGRRAIHFGEHHGEGLNRLGMAASAGGFMSSSVAMVQHLAAAAGGPSRDRATNLLRAGGDGASALGSGAGFVRSLEPVAEHAVAGTLANGAGRFASRAGQVAGALNLAVNGVDMYQHGLTDENMTGMLNAGMSFATPQAQVAWAAGQAIGNQARDVADAQAVRDHSFAVPTTGRDGRQSVRYESGTDAAARAGDATRQRLIAGGTNGTLAAIAGGASTIGHSFANTAEGLGDAIGDRLFRWTH